MPCRDLDRETLGPHIDPLGKFHACPTRLNNLSAKLQIQWFHYLVQRLGRKLEDLVQRENPLNHQVKAQPLQVLFHTLPNHE